MCCDECARTEMSNRVSLLVEVIKWVGGFVRGIMSGHGVGMCVGCAALSRMNLR